MNQMSMIPGFWMVVILAILTSESHGFVSRGGQERKLSDCPVSPNCVSSQSRDPRHAIEPLRFESLPDEAFECLKKIIRNRKRTTMVYEDMDFVHAESRTLLGFADDVKLLLDRENRTIHMRSASRHGYWDLGVNRRRLEDIRSTFTKQCGK